MSRWSLVKRLSLQSPPAQAPRLIFPSLTSTISLSAFSTSSHSSTLRRASNPCPLLPHTRSLHSTPLREASTPTLGNLSPAPGSSHKRKRVGRGIGSGRGGTSGRGHKGQGARSGNGKPKLHFAGGQTPITRAFPKRGFTNPLRQEFVTLNLDRLQHWIDKGLIDPLKPITMKELFETRCVHGIKQGVKLLGNGAEFLTTPHLNITVSKASASAIDAIEALQGSVTTRYENRLTLRALVNPSSFERRGLSLPGKADPIKRRDILYYSDPKHRGYLWRRHLVAAPESNDSPDTPPTPSS